MEKSVVLPYSAGDIPMYRRKTVAKYCEDEKPNDNAVSRIV
jgi:hypothetical protein